MADNRIFLIHQPTGLGIMLAKRRSESVLDNGEDIDKFYNMVNEKSKSYEEIDDIVLMNENTNYGEPWEYKGDIKKVDGVFTKFKRVK